MRRFIAPVACALFVFVGSGQLGTAQEATPGAARDVPAASECTVPAAKSEVVLAAFHEAFVAASQSSTVEPVAPTTDLTGTDADAETVAAVTKAVREIIACTNLHGFLGLVPVSTERHISDIFSGDIGRGATEEDAATFLGQEPEALSLEESVAFVAVTDVVILNDGRIVATTFGDEPGVDDSDLPLTFIFVKQGDRLLLDETIEPETDATPTA